MGGSSGAEQPAFGTLLRRHRLAWGLTQEALAERARLSAKSVSALETGLRRRPYRATIDRLAGALGLSLPQREELAAMARRGPRAGTGPGRTAARDGQRAELPVPPAPMVGRGADLVLALELLARPEVRLVTITGSPGVGKSRFALELARTLRPGLDEVRFVPLAALADPGQVGPAIQQALAVPDGAAPVEERLAAHIGARHLLLLLDNFEHVLAAARLVASLLAACAELHLLVTSRAPLGVRGEHRLPLAPLEVADASRRLPPAELCRVPAVELFVQRARAANPGFRLAAENAATVAEICRRLDGLPLALELAAPWLATLSPDVLLARLEDRLPLLAHGPADLAEHQRTLRDALRWSHELLGPCERVLFRRLSAFRGTFDLAAAEAVCAGDGLAAGDVPVCLARLVEKSLVIMEPEPGRPARYRLLDTIRAYAAERLAAAEAPDAVHGRHALFHLRMAEAARDPRWSPGGVGLIHRLEASHPDLHAALRWHQAHDVSHWVQMVTALGWFWTTYSHLDEGREWLLAVLEMVPRASIERCRVMHQLGALLYWQGQYAAARGLLARSLALAEALDDPEEATRITASIGHTALDAGDRAAARAAYERVMIGPADAGLRALALVRLGDLHLLEGHVTRARHELERGLAMATESGSMDVVARAELFLGIAAYFEGDHREAGRRAARSLREYARIGHWSGVAGNLESLAVLAVEGGDAVRALRLSGAAAGIRRRIGSPLPEGWQGMVMSAALEPARALAGASADQAWADGARLSVPDAVRYALEAEPGLEGR